MPALSRNLRGKLPSYRLGRRRLFGWRPVAAQEEEEAKKDDRAAQEGCEAGFLGEDQPRQEG
jgi:hypothetical protein